MVIGLNGNRVWRVIGFKMVIGLDGNRFE